MANRMFQALRSLWEPEYERKKAAYEAEVKRAEEERLAKERKELQDIVDAGDAANRESALIVLWNRRVAEATEIFESAKAVADEESSKLEAFRREALEAQVPCMKDARVDFVFVLTDQEFILF